MTQQSFSSLEQAHKKKRTKREIFLGEMEAAVPWARLEALIAPHYTKQRLGRPQMPLAVMLRIYFLQQWYYLSDPGAEEALYDMHSMREFAGLDLAHDGRVASITGQARSTLTRENGQPTDSNLAQPSSVILLRARTPICASVF